MPDRPLSKHYRKVIEKEKIEHFQVTKFYTVPTIYIRMLETKGPEETKATFYGNWFRSSDIARIDEEGYLSIVDRLKDMIINGEKMSIPGRWKSLCIIVRKSRNVP